MLCLCWLFVREDIPRSLHVAAALLVLADVSAVQLAFSVIAPPRYVTWPALSMLFPFRQCLFALPFLPI